MSKVPARIWSWGRAAPSRAGAMAFATCAAYSARAAATVSSTSRDSSAGAISR
ncbi:hypothetical protein ACFQ9X_00950 [Catenulispora yoronensis]